MYIGNTYKVIYDALITLSIDGFLHMLPNQVPISTKQKISDGVEISHIDFRLPSNFLILKKDIFIKIYIDGLFFYLENNSPENFNL